MSRRPEAARRARATPAANTVTVGYEDADGKRRMLGAFDARRQAGVDVLSRVM
jgi:hypothetical protein